MVAAGERLERDQPGVGRLQQRRGGMVGDLRRAGASRQVRPADSGPVEPVGDLDLAAGPAPVDHRGEGAHAAVRARQPRAFAGHGAALTAAVAEVDRQQRQSRWPGDRTRLGRQRAHRPGDGPPVGLGQRIAPAGPRQARSAAKLAGDRRAELAAALVRRSRRDGRDRRQQQQRDQEDEPDVLDRRGAVFGGASARGQARRRLRARGARRVTKPRPLRKGPRAPRARA